MSTSIGKVLLAHNHSHQLHIFHACFHAKTAELGGCDRDNMALTT